MITIDQASEMGAKGAEPTETERLLFEAWMRGHCWLVQGDWDGKSYVHESENTGYLHPGAMLTRQLWAAWRDRAALAEQPAQLPVGEVGEIDIDEDGQAFAWLALHKNVDIGDKLYTSPPPQRKPLTLGQKQRLWSSVGDKPTLKDRVNAYGLAIEAAHGIKENT